MLGPANAYRRWIALGIVAIALSRGLEAMGDAAPYAEAGVSGERLTFHLAALVLLIVGGAAFVRALIGAVRTIQGKVSARAATPARAAAAVFSEPSRPDGDFDADAAFARYMERKAAGEVQTVTAIAASLPRQGFGRKGA